MQVQQTADHKANPIATMALAALRQFAQAETGAVAKLDSTNIRKAVQPPADTVTPTWAAELVAATVLDFFQTVPGSVLGALIPFATTLQITNPVTVPGHVTPSEAATFIGQRLPIPVISGAIDSGPKIRTDKLAVIVLATRELLAAGAGADALLQSVLGEAISMGGDAVLLGNGAGTDNRPPGLAFGLTALVGSDDAVADTKAMVEAATRAMVRPVWLMNPSQVIGATHDNIVDNGAIGGAPVVANQHVAVGDVWLLDAADLIINAGTAVEFLRTDEAAINANDAPAAIVDEGGVLAMPVVSLYQQNLVAVRAVLPVYWSMRDTASVIKLTGATW